MDSIREFFVRSFQTAYGIPVEWQGCNRPLDYLMREEEAGIPYADVIHSSGISDFLVVRDLGVLSPYRPKAAEKIDPALRHLLADPNDYWFALRMSTLVIVYDAEKVGPDEAPRSWRDLLDPRWKNRITVAHPGYTPSALAFTHAIRRTVADDYFDRLAGNAPLVGPNQTNIIMAGQAQLGVGAHDSEGYYFSKYGQPLQLVYPTEGAPLIVSPQALMKSAPYPNAAKLFIEHTMSREIQQRLVRISGWHSPRSDVQSPDDAKALSQIKTIAVDAADLMVRERDVVSAFTRVYGTRVVPADRVARPFTARAIPNEW
ncbi:MAG: extracellular solute-binding protein [Chloroflexi bacterium]|nr:extracellular solute-binding protein [Chloroflexota bacterium]